MKKKKIQTDNVEQLLEIVRAIQQGEDPEKAVEEKRAESLRNADSPKPHSEKTKAKNLTAETDDIREETPEERVAEEKLPEEKQQDKVQKRKTKKKAKSLKKNQKPENDDFDDDEFERLLNEDGEENPKDWLPVQLLSAGAARISGLLKRTAKASQKKKDRPEALSDTETPETDTSEKPEGSGGTAEAEVSSEPEEMSEPEISGGSGRKAEPEISPEPDGTSEPEMAEEAEVSKGSEVTKETEMPEAADTPEETPNQRSDESMIRQKAISRQRGRQERKSVKEYIGDFLDELGEKGIHKKELLMLGIGVLLVLLILFVVIHFFVTSFEQKRKAKNVTADQGLTVTVEEEPEAWCTSSDVALKFSASQGTVTQVMVNGTSYQVDDRGIVTIHAEDWLLEASVTTDAGEMNARIEVPMIDSVAPVVHAQRTGDQIELTADDGRSGVRKIYYAVIYDNDYLRLPQYQEYSGPISFESGACYYFYAADMAGNHSVPMVTTMEEAEEIVLKDTELTMSPGEEQYLTAEAVPSGALLSNLQYESMNEAIVTVNGSGAVTALQEGTTAVRITADGVNQISCTVNVSNSRTVTISAIGDCTLGTDEAFNTTTSLPAYDAMNGHSYFFRNVKEILEKDDVTFANMEGTLTESTTREQKEYAFKGDPSYTEILAEGSVEVVTLANNHSSDYGAQSLEDTEKYLAEAGIDYCINDTIAVRNVNGVRCAFIGIYALQQNDSETRVQQTIAKAKSQGAQLIIVAFHWGSEKASQPDANQQSLAHLAIDSGADLVVGHHPHVLQGIEKYNGKYIAYSLGNFCFGGNSAPSDMDTMIFRQTFTITDGQTADDDRVEIIPCSVSSASGYNNYQPTPVQGSEAERIMNRINEASAVYGLTFEASDGL